MVCLNITEKEMMERGGILDKMMDNAFDAAILVDRRGTIIHVSQGSLEMTKSKIDLLLGNPIKDFDPLSPFAEVLQTGKAVLSFMVIIKGRKCMTNVIPIISNNEVIGVLGMVLFQNMANLKKILTDLGEQVENLQAKRNMYDILSRVDYNYTFDDYIGESREVKEMLDYCRHAAKTLYPVLITGETGTGKEILANAFHSATLTDTFTPFVKINCSAIPKELLESELFGYEKGAFTGALSSKKGKFEIASGGTILLDEIGDMDLNLQSKLLRVIEEKEFEKVGGTTLISLNARIIASTNQDLKQRIKEGLFRQDLYYRLNAIEISIPPLRSRREDIPILIRHFLNKGNYHLSFTADAVEIFKQYDWPGNVRELRNVINRFSLNEKEEIVGESAVKALLGMGDPVCRDKAGRTLTSINEGEKECILRSLEQSGYNISGSSRLLGISRATLYAKIRKYNIILKKNLSC